jgi:acyl-coenzyme A synthetase/AMP-(fatty) acid ligase
VFDVWASLSRGASIVVVDESAVLSGRRMLDRVHDRAISVWYSVPSALVLMLESGLTERGAPSLRVVFFAGEVFAIKHLRRAMSAIPHARFFNLFGPTETNVCLACELTAPPAADAEAIPIGRACCGDEILILDADGEQVPDGQIGELFVAGPTVMLGYWEGGRRPQAPHPYPTGDMVLRRSDGQLMYHGRRDHMVKVHGHRVELGEVEAILQAHELIQEAIAFAIEQRLVAVIVPAHTSLSVLDVKRHCAERLPRYMIPNDIRIVHQLARTSSGKVDRGRARAAVVADAGEVLVVSPAREPAH